MQVGIMGLPNIGKSTLFSALTASEISISNYPFCTIKPNIGYVPVNDKRLDLIFKLVGGKEKIPAKIKIVDLAGLVKGASQGEGLGNEFLSYVRAADALVHLVRCFTNKEIAHIDLRLDPLRDIEIVDTELILDDLNIIEKRLEKVEKSIRTGGEKLKEEKAILEKLKVILSSGEKLSQVALSPEEIEKVEEYALLTIKPVIYAANIDGLNASPEGSSLVNSVKERAELEETGAVTLSASWEKELTEFSQSEREEFKKDLGIKESSLETLISGVYKLLDLITFYTAQDGKVQAWPAPKGIAARGAAGEIHSDMERGFILAEVCKFSDLKETESLQALKEKGLVRTEGKDYLIQDGDIVQFRFRN